MAYVGTDTLTQRSTHDHYRFSIINSYMQSYTFCYSMLMNCIRTYISVTVPIEYLYNRDPNSVLITCSNIHVERETLNIRYNHQCLILQKALDIDHYFSMCVHFYF